MEVDFVLCCLFTLGLTVCVGLHPLPVNCTGCVCKSPNGAVLSLDDIFDDPIRKMYNKASYCFPSCLQNNPCSNGTSDLVYVSKDSVQTCRSSNIVYIQTDVNYTQHVQLAIHNQCRIIISCFPPPVQLLDDDVVFNVSDRNCGKLKSFVSSANVNATSANMLSSFTPVMLNTTLIPLPSVSPSSSIVMSLPSTMMLSPSTMMSSPSSVTPSSNVVPPSHPRDSDGNKLLYIVIPTAAPAAFIISFITVFCLLNWCHQRNKKKLYIKLTSTIYSEEDDSDNSDDYD